MSAANKRKRGKCWIVRKYERSKRGIVPGYCIAATKDHVFLGFHPPPVLMYERKGEGKQIGTFKGHQGEVTCMCITEDRKGLITGSLDKTIIHWTISNQEKVRTFRGHTWGVLSVDAYGDLLVSGGRDKTLILWSVSKGDRLRNLRGHTDWIQCLKFSSFDGKSVFSGCDDTTVIRWKVSNGAQIMQYRGGHTRPVTSLAVTRDDSKLITGSEDHTCIIWNVVSGDGLNIFRGHKGSVVSVALSPCERFFASASGDRTTIIWDIAKANPALVLADHDGGVVDVTFSGRRRLLTASYDHTIIEYDINSVLKDIPARIEFLLVLQTHHSAALSTSDTTTSNGGTAQQALLNFGAYVNSRPRLKGRILSYI